MFVLIGGLRILNFWWSAGMSATIELKIVLTLWEITFKNDRVTDGLGRSGMQYVYRRLSKHNWCPMQVDEGLIFCGWKAWLSGVQDGLHSDSQNANHWITFVSLWVDVFLFVVFRPVKHERVNLQALNAFKCAGFLLEYYIYNQLLMAGSQIDLSGEEPC